MSQRAAEIARIFMEEGPAVGETVREYVIRRFRDETIADVKLAVKIMQETAPVDQTVEAMTSWSDPLTSHKDAAP
jgi:hypothetical protein